MITGTISIPVSITGNLQNTVRIVCDVTISPVTLPKYNGAFHTED